MGTTRSKKRTGASERYENKRYSRAGHVNKVFPSHSKKLVLLLLPHVICHALSEVKHTSVARRYWPVNLKRRNRKTDNDCSVTGALIKKKCLSMRSPCTCIYLGFLPAPHPPSPQTLHFPPANSQVHIIFFNLSVRRSTKKKKKICNHS